jgi:uncharacterized protein
LDRWPIDRLANPIENEPAQRVGTTPAEGKMADDLNRERVLKFLDAFYAGDSEAAAACCDAELDSITYAPIELFPHLGHKHGNAWVAEAIRTQQQRYSSRTYELKFMAVDGDRIATMLIASLRKHADDRVVHLEIADFFTLRAGLILVHRSFFDSFNFVQQVLGEDLTDSFATSVRDAMRR